MLNGADLELRTGRGLHPVDQRCTNNALLVYRAEIHVLTVTPATFYPPYTHPCLVEDTVSKQPIVPQLSWFKRHW